MLPPAPDLLSTTNGVPNVACRCCCRMRASRSAEPPAANGTTMVTGRCGQVSCACAGAAAARMAATQATSTTRIRYSISRNSQSRRASHRLEMRVAALVEILVGIAHRVGLGAADHYLEIDRLEAVVLIAVNHSGGAGDAFPWSEPRGEPLAALVLDEHVEKALQHEKAFFDLMGVRGIALTGLHIHDRKREILRGDDVRIGMLAGAAGA